MLIAGGSIVAAVIAAAGFSWFDLNRFWEHTSAEVAAIANIVADQAGPAIALQDRKAAGEILGSLRAEGLVRDAVLYDGQGRCFAEYHRISLTSCPPRPADGVHRGPDALVLVRAVEAPGERLGTLLLAASVPSVKAILRQYLGSAGLIMALSLVVAAVLAMVLQARVSAPILTIARVAERIAETHRFSDRVAVVSSDELGVLAESFNTMLDEIERRDAELRLAKDKAEDLARLKSEFLANMSHEIRTPMNGVVGMISLVLDRCSDPQEKEQLLVAQNAAQSLVGILNDILDLSKIEAGKMTLETIDFDLQETVRDSLRVFEISIREKALHLEITIGHDCPAWVRGDPMRLRQVLVNLAGNAVKFTAQGKVQIRVAPATPGVIRFEVRDTGIGIPPEKLKFIFDPFTQADGSHTRRFGGTGLGLTITRRLVCLMGGELWAESDAGHGSRFYFDLPLPPCSEPAAEIDTATQTEPKLPQLHVLVAEDNLINQKVICAILARQGWTIELAGTGAEAYRRFLERRFDLILMDIQMPELDGVEATRLIRQHEIQCRLPRTPIMALTAHSSPIDHARYLAEGMDAIVTKPVNLPTVLREVGALLTRSGNVPA